MDRTSNQPVALITGITGQDGSYLASHLLRQGYRVFGFVRDESWAGCRVWSEGEKDQITPLHGDLSEGQDIAIALNRARPDEIYNLASESRPSLSWRNPARTLSVNGEAAVRLFEAARHIVPEARIFQASSSEMFGVPSEVPQSSKTPFLPSNPYAASKVYAHQMAGILRAAYGMHICCGILFNHESERRPNHFLTQKIAYGAACAARGIDHSTRLNERGRPMVENGKLMLGNLNVRRDWGYAPEFVEAMHLLLQNDVPSDCVIGTGVSSSIADLCEAAYAHVGLDWRDHVASDEALKRPLETGDTVADASEPAAVLGGWRAKTPLAVWVGRMVDHQAAQLS
ncbi:GDP-mannose 4,6-dehydratase [bacterium]|nr:GDP-mannose 4,6-dehydratase [bacterium]